MVVKVAKIKCPSSNKLYFLDTIEKKKVYIKGYKPAPFISEFISCYFEVDMTQIPGDSKELVWPDGTFGLLFLEKNKEVYRSLDTKTKLLNVSGTSFFGQKTKPVNYKYFQSNKTTFGIKIKPKGMALFVNDSLSSTKDCFFEVDIINRDLSILEAQIFEANTIQEKIAVIDRYILRSLQNKGSQSDYILFSKITEYIDRKKGDVGLSHLYHHFNLNYKKVERLFSFYLGVSPKTYLRIVRFNHTIQLQSQLKELNLTQLGNELGFYDQSHFIREFKRFSTLTPKDFFRRENSHSEDMLLSIISEK